ncbi:MAG: transglutaminase-like domain-containing protein [Candidatus Latescibacterota bacterium]
MSTGKRIAWFAGASLLIWAAVMGLVYRTNQARKTSGDLTAMSGDVTAKGEIRKYYHVYRGGVKAGYLIASRVTWKNLKVLREEAVLKVNFSGMSREIFIQSTAGVDSASMRLEYSDFRMQSGAHVFAFNSSLNEDSLLINVRMNSLSPWRRGVFITGGNILPEVALPFWLRYSPSSNGSVQVFDPVIFAPREANVVRGATETLKIQGRNIAASKYDIRSGEGHASVWVDSLSWLVRGEGIRLLGPALGEFTLELAGNRDIFFLPIETTLGRDAVRSWSIPIEQAIPNPRGIEYLEVELDGVRAATVDIESPNKKVLSLNPLTLGIHNRPVAEGERLSTLLHVASVDTALVGASDYIQSKDARMARAALEIVGAERDTLSMARSINRWVYGNVRKDSATVITRSIDILRSLRGGCDEHTKLFTALARSIGIPVQINAGLVYENGSFRYHSWPSVFAGGTWRDLDPWYGQDAADAAHIALVRGDFERLNEIIRLIDVLSVKVLTYR